MAALPAIPFAEWIKKYGLAAAPLVRYNALSPNGLAMLNLYAKGVKRMMSTPPGDPRSWVFQWYSHWVKGPQTAAPKAAEIASTYGPSPSPWKSLAQDMWDNCQAHGPGEDENWFLPWHRMFVYFFERIVRSVTQSSFTLPYWNYSVSGVNHGVIPKPFRLPKSPIFGPLYVDKRNPGVNQGQAIDQGQPGNPLGLVALSECSYSPVGARQGFCMRLDGSVHGMVHVLTGNTQNMGSVPWAGGDPVFWAHHCNIDRLWASWNKAGRQNPSDPAFLAKTFVFADEHGNKVVAKIQDFLKLPPLGYSYDQYEPAPGCGVSLAALAAIAGRLQKRFVAPSGPIALGTEPVRVSLGDAPEATEKVAFSTRVQALPSAGNLRLVVKGLRAEDHPGVLYHVYLDLPAEVPPEKGGQHYVGSFSFFDGVGHSEGDAVGPEKFFSFDITRVSRTLQSRNLLGDRPTITIRPLGQPAGEARAMIGEISLVEEPALVQPGS